MDERGPESTSIEETPRIEVQGRNFDVTIEQFLGVFTNFAPTVRKNPAQVFDAAREIYALAWDAWAPTVAVTEIVVTTQPAPAGHPPQTVSSSVKVVGFGFRPGVPVRLKWNNAWGFPGTSVALPDGVPDSHGRFGLVLQHATIPKAGKSWVWEQMNQLVLVAQQPRPNGSIENYADYRPVPPHVLWQWVP
ncbi:MAG: hypothetical protein ABI592_04825 [Acidobacteriota bacterium]